MTWNLGLFVRAVLIAVAVGLVLVIFLGPILTTLKVPIAVTVGHSLTDYGFAIGVLIGLWYYFSNGAWINRA